MHTLPQKSAGDTLFLFFASFRRSKSTVCHLLCEATCSLANKKPGNVTSVVEYSKIVRAQQLGDRIMHIIHIFWGSCRFHVSNIIVELRKLIQKIIKLIFFVGELISKLALRVSSGYQTLQSNKTTTTSWFQMFLARLETRWNSRTRFWNITSNWSFLTWSSRFL